MDQVRTGRWMVAQVSLWMLAVVAVASLMAVTAPASADPSRRVGLALVVGGVGTVVGMGMDRRLSGVVAGGVSVGFGLLLRDDPGRFGEPIVYAIAGIAGAVGLVVGIWLQRRGFGWVVAVSTAILAGATGWLFIRYETELLPLGLGLIGLSASTVAGAGFMLAARESGMRGGQVSIGSALRSVGRWIESQLDDSGGVDGSREIAGKLFFEGDQRGRQLIRFYALMGFASAIASLGILADSTAVVIGAMLIAPLMTPLMAASLSLVSLWTERLLSALVIVATGALIPITVGVVLTAVFGPGVDPATNSQIVSRASPTLLDLAIALGAGAAGAYANSRRDVADSLPGVAVAIALVPPLAVVGAAGQLGDWEASQGAALLFVTNALAIVAMGSLTFVMTGVARPSSGARGAVRHWVVAFAAFGFVVLWSLMESTSSANATGARTSISRGIVEAWASERSFDVGSVAIDGATVEVVLIGETAPDEDSVDELAQQLAFVVDDVVLDLSVDLTVRIMVPPD